jgi:hypothetical protein
MLPSHRRTVLCSHTIMSFAILSSNLSHVSKQVFQGVWHSLPEVVRHDNDTAAEGVDGVRQTVNSRNIETVGRFVK